jgi:hypothetical protein
MMVYWTMIKNNIILLCFIVCPMNIFAHVFSKQDTFMVRGSMGLEAMIEINKSELKYSDPAYHFKVLLLGGLRYQASHYMIKLDGISISGMSKDRYNNNKSNFSFYPVINIVLMAISSNNDSSITPYVLLNRFLYSTHYFLFVEPKFIHDRGFKGMTPTCGIFLKNHTEIYPFRKNKWLNLSPGIGLSLITGSFVFEIGMSKNIDIISGRLKTSNCLHFSLLGFAEGD